jgi:crotonobetainyl-CoA:carnitine CoA-transferase CaiB-like acyl-CoA transferase
MTPLPYEGLAVVDMSMGVAGPGCGAMLGLNGARVIKIEPPDGDWIRVMGGGRDGLTANAIVGNLGKRSICVDARKPGGRALILELAAKADVVIENFRPGVMRKLGLDYESLAAANPGLVYVSITGFGESGPWAQKAGTDSVLQAYTGMTMLNKEDSGRPKRLGMLVPDTISALYAAQCVGAALFGRTRGGGGRHIEISLAECCAAFQSAPMVDEALFADRYKPPVAVPAGVFGTVDGFVTLLTLRQDMWERLCTALGREAWLEDPRFATNELRGEHAAEINRLVADVLVTRGSKEWIAILEKNDVLCAEVQGYAQFREHPQMRHMGYFGRLEQAPYGTLEAPYLPGTGRGAPLPPAPLAGEHTREILAEMGRSPHEIEALEAAGIVVARKPSS